MADQLYDEFGNYIGPELDEEDDLENEDIDQNWEDDDVGRADLEDEEIEMEEKNDVEMKEEVPEEEMRIVLHEDKNYYPTADEVFGDAEVLVEEEDTQPLETPIIQPATIKQFEYMEKELPSSTSSLKFMAGLMDHPNLIRNLSIVGHFHHGKTTFMDMFVKQTHLKKWDPHKEVKYTDRRFDEQQRGLSVKAVPMSFVLQNLKEKSYLLNIMDTPGHCNFSDEMTASLRISDGVVLIVDAIEGVMLQTEKCIKNAILEGLPIILVINKIDRLILELKIPPTDAYLKLHHTIQEVNEIIESMNGSQKVSPIDGTVCFASGIHNWIFSVQSFAKLYSDYHKNFDPSKFAKKLWGNVYFDRSTRKFSKKPVSAESKQNRSFVEFILDPLYKIYSYVLSTQGGNLANMLDEIGVSLSASELHLDPKPLLKLVLGRFFGDVSALVDAAVKNFPSPLEKAKEKAKNLYTGDLDSEIGDSLMECDAKGPLVINIVKLYPRPDGSSFDAFGRVFSGAAKVGDKVKVLGEHYSLDDSEDMRVKEISKIWIYQSRYRVEINRVIAGNWALFEGIDQSIAKTATVVALDKTDDACIFRPLKFWTSATVKVAIEPINPSELPKMDDGLKKINKSYPLATMKVEDSGEHIILGTGELYLDCVLHDLRKLYSEIEIKVADPVSTFCETVSETSSLQCFAETPNKQNKLTMIAEPLDSKIGVEIESERIKIDSDRKEMESYFQDEFGWDLLTARSIWAFGPDNYGPNILFDDTLPTEVDKVCLDRVKSSVIQGFQWGTKEGPLCCEPIRDVKFKLLDCNISEDPFFSAPGQIIPTSRRVAYCAFLLATPRLMEPIMEVEIISPADCVSAIYNVIQLRRGHVISSKPKPGAPLYIVNAYIPVIDSFGFETDLRTHTQGAAFCLSTFHHWDIVPGDPLDKNVELRTLEPAAPDALAREFMIKTRRRKGLSEEVSINKFFEESMLLELAKQDAELQSYFE